VIERRTVDELGALLSGAATLSRAGNRIAAIGALRSAVGLAPEDLTAHRRLAAACALAGDRDSARGEYDRFIARLEARGSFDAAVTERSYATMLLAPRTIVRLAIAPPAQRRLRTDHAFALRRVEVAIVAIVATIAATFAAGPQIFASAHVAGAVAFALLGLAGQTAAVREAPDMASAMPSGTNQVTFAYDDHTDDALYASSAASGASPTPERSATSAPTGTDSWTAQYFSNMTLSGTPTTGSSPATLDFDWGYGGPASLVDKWSARFTINATFDGGAYVFAARADDGVRILIDGTLLLDGWRDQPVTTYTATKTLSGDHLITVEYYDNADDAVLHVWWALAAVPPAATTTETAAPSTTPAPTPRPTVAPISLHTATPLPTPRPTVAPTSPPTATPVPTPRPTVAPTSPPTATPVPTPRPTVAPTSPPTVGHPAGQPILKSGPARFGRQILGAGETMIGGTIDAQGEDVALEVSDDSTVDGVEIFNTGSGYGAAIMVNGDRVYIHDCFIHNTANDGINVNRDGDAHGIKDLTITNCLIQDNGGDSIHIKGSNRGDGQAPTQAAAMENIRITYTKSVRSRGSFGFEFQDGQLNCYFAYNESDTTYSVVGHTGLQMIGNTVTTNGWGYEVGNMVNGLWDSNLADGSISTAFAFTGDTVNSNTGTTYRNNRVSNASDGFSLSYGQRNTFTNNGFHNVGTWSQNSGLSYDDSHDVTTGAYEY